MGLLIDGVWQDQPRDTAATGGRFVRDETAFRNWVTPDGSGAIGAACEVPETAAKSKPATVIANIVRSIVCPPWTRIVFAKHITPEHDGGSRTLE